MNQITVYGDSIAAGYGAPPTRGFVPVLTRLCSRQVNLPLDYRNYGQPGMTSYALSSALRFNDAWITGGLTAQIICVLIGGDDLIQNVPILLSLQRAEVERALKASAFAYANSLRRIRALTRHPLAVGTLYNPYPARPPPTLLFPYTMNASSFPLQRSSALQLHRSQRRLPGDRQS
ncbi:GDSL-type esterase/lipase family protein [Ferroacidibacillus organovorans]|uniref:SGNH hydrolase-type esterase domain-containing protein n=1 Tax=Ferroacidibacillus organovorans TaxID=1765683 RepID=A0A101XS99_9BACL|nr:GDSL-type esterase/lipase family protein [Ferroacidibacillus organovorans]KUO96609.1 hypothetical protein ATW55_00580 [Ferroacidibacillus organovorans]